MIFRRYDIKSVAMWSNTGNSKSQVHLPSTSATWKWSGVETEVVMGVSFVAELIHHNITSLWLHCTLRQESQADTLQAQNWVRTKLFLQPLDIKLAIR